MQHKPHTLGKRLFLDLVIHKEGSKDEIKYNTINNKQARKDSIKQNEISMALAFISRKSLTPYITDL